MSFNASRLTCFALISAIETDARDTILRLEAVEPLPWPESIQESATRRLQQDRGSGTQVTHETLLNYIDFAHAHELLLARKAKLSPNEADSLRVIGNRLGQLTQARNRVAHSRPLEINDLPLCLDVAKELSRVAPGGWPETTEALERLEHDPSHVLALKVTLPVDPIDEPHHNLPIPDFDETGFLGRSATLRKIKRYVLGSWPAISILGDGGIGKTSIALKVAYDLLDDPKANFDSIVWVTAKAHSLTPHEIERISDAIQDSLGLFREAATELGGASAADDPIEELLAYMEEFKVLLILDNMETVTDNRLREFLREIPLGSKVLMTSRIGVHKENDVKLDPLSHEESRQLLGALAHGRNVKALKDLDSNGVDSLVQKTNGHPLYIKWVVTGVQSGQRPQDMIANNKLLMDYCMSNVYEQLGRVSKRVLQSMQVMRGVRYQGELAYLNNLSAVDTQKSLLDLMRTNFVSMTALGDLDAGYEIGDFASQYLAKNQPVDDIFRTQVVDRQSRLTDLGSRLQRGNRYGKYDSRSIDVRGQQDVPAARILVNALRDLRANKIDRALSLCAEAHTLSPGYYETRRVEALVQTVRRDTHSALRSYEEAVELADGPAKSLALFHFGAFLADELGDYAAALSNFEQAANQQKPDPEIFARIALCNFSLGRYLLALGSYTALLKLPIPESSKYQSLIGAMRSAVFGAEEERAKGNLALALELVEGARDAFEACAPRFRDATAIDWAIHLARIGEEIGSELSSDPYLHRKAAELASSLRDVAVAERPAAIDRLTGITTAVLREKNFGFIETNSAKYFFHVNDLEDRRQWHVLAENNLAAFTPENHPHSGKHRATQVVPLL